jgi:diguanylate cyclase (GGDEF)-like protein
MRSIEEVLEIISESNYFHAWKEVLLSNTSSHEWELLLKHQDSDEFYNLLADKLHTNNVPYVIVTEYIDEFFRYFEDHSINQHKVKNNIAQAFLKKKLKYDSQLIEIEISKKLSSTLETKRDLINAHLRWMQAFITTIIDKPQKFELDATKCHVGRWLIEDSLDTKDSKIHELHQNLHAMAQSALRMYKREDYAYFLLLYIDILMSSYQIRDLIMNIYFARRITSIYRDPLSKQANYFQLKHDIPKYDSNSSLFMFNMKEFSKINLLYGHEVGDCIIKGIIEIVLKIDDVDEVYRIYGDEFAIICPTEQRSSVIYKLKTNLENHVFDISTNSITLSFHGSVASITPHVLERCEYGLIISKSHHGLITNVDTIDEKLLHSYANNITLSQQLRLAFMDNRIFPYFQPIYNIKTGTVTKYEALMRIEDLNGDILEPASFLEVLQGMYIYPEVTKLMIKKTFEIFKDNDLEFSINLSFADIIDIDTEGFIIAMLKRYPETAKRCTFELLENEAIHNHEEVCEFFALLHTYGVNIALDDFGVGYSNYDTIFKFDLDYIKIDGSLIESISTSDKSLVLVESIITVAKKLDAKLIVEFVSSKEIFDIVSSLEIDYLQGYYIGMPAEKLL